MRRRVWTCLLAALSGSACQGAASDPGLDAMLRLDPAQFVPGGMPAPNGGPAVASAHVPQNTLPIDSTRARLSGAADVGATSVLVARVGDVGYWVVSTGYPTNEEPNYPSYGAQMELARDFPEGSFVLLLSAVDREGKVGERRRLALNAASTPTTGTLSIALRWENTADLDLQVQTPQGQDIYTRNINTYDPPAPGQPAPDAGAWRAGGLLDLDSNAGCVDDGRSLEHVTWRDVPPSGEYIVRVSTAALCGEAAAHWSVTVTLDGMQLAAATGISLPTDTRYGTGARSGVRALSFVVP